MYKTVSCGVLGADHMTFSQSDSPKLVTCLTIKQLNAHFCDGYMIVICITRSWTSCSPIVSHMHPPCRRFLRLLGNACQPKLTLLCITYRGCKSTGKRHGVQSGDRSEQLVQRCSLSCSYASMLHPKFKLKVT